jgi:hypothetical protein
VIMSMLVHFFAAAFLSAASVQDTEGNPDNSSELGASAAQLRHSESGSSNDALSTETMAEQGRLERGGSENEDEESTASTAPGVDDPASGPGLKPAPRAVDRGTGRRHARIPDQRNRYQ